MIIIPISIGGAILLLAGGCGLYRSLGGYFSQFQPGKSSG